MEVGEKVTFSCPITVDGHIANHKYRVDWIANNDRGKNYGELRMSNKEFVIKSASLRHNGNYTCSSLGKNENGKKYRFLATAVLKVFGMSRYIRV